MSLASKINRIVLGATAAVSLYAAAGCGEEKEPVPPIVAPDPRPEDTVVGNERTLDPENLDDFPYECGKHPNGTGGVYSSQIPLPTSTGILQMNLDSTVPYFQSFQEYLAGGDGYVMVDNETLASYMPELAGLSTPALTFVDADYYGPGVNGPNNGKTLVQILQDSLDDPTRRAMNVANNAEGAFKANRYIETLFAALQNRRDKGLEIDDTYPLIAGRVSGIEFVGFAISENTINGTTNRYVLTFNTDCLPDSSPVAGATYSGQYARYQKAKVDNLARAFVEIAAGGF